MLFFIFTRYNVEVTWYNQKTPEPVYNDTEIRIGHRQGSPYGRKQKKGKDRYVTGQDEGPGSHGQAKSAT